ncbi:MAG: tetratricopeptide repeat protein [Acidobacteriota bacterium]
MTDWASAGAMLVAGIIIGALFLGFMRRRKESGDADLRDLEAKRDALVQRLREVDLEGDEKERLEADAANVLRQIDRRAPAARRAEARPTSASGDKQAAMKGFAWGVGSVLVLVGIGWFVTQKAQPREAAGPQQAAPMQAAQPQADAEVKGIEAAVAQRPDDLVLRNQLARAYLDRENLMGVFEQTQYVLQRAPNDAQALTYQSLVRMAMGQTDSATSMLKQAIKSDPKFLDAYVALAWSQTSAGKSDDAAATIKAAQKENPEQEARLADVLAKMREQAKAQPAALPPDHPPIEGADAALHVTLQIAPGVTPPPQGVIFVIARAAGVTAGPPAAVKRLPLSAFPLTVELSSADSMMGQPLPSKVRLEARIDSDGNAMTKDPKDPVAVADNVTVGSSATLTFH